MRRLTNANAVKSRTMEILKSMRAGCDCGGDPRSPGWHHEGCASEVAWDRAWDRATDEIGEFVEDRFEIERDDQSGGYWVIDTTIDDGEPCNVFGSMSLAECQAKCDELNAKSEGKS